jgi:diaminopimelate decarboxylase
MADFEPPFHYRGRDLFVEDVALRDVAQQVGTPVYVYSGQKIQAQFEAFNRAFAGLPHLICYAVKANSNLAVLNLLSGLGAGMDIVSLGELFRARRAGVPAHRVVFSGVGKTDVEMAAALKAGILAFNVESAEELEALHRVAQSLRRAAPVSIRVNPNVAVDTHRHIATGKAENKFGVPYAQAEALYLRANRMPWLKIMGIQSHIGSQITEVRPYVETLRKLMALVDRLEKRGIFLHMIDLGGGLGVTYKSEKPPRPADVGRALLPILADRNLRLVFEPGRFLVAEAGALVTRVLYRKNTGAKNFVIVDAAMNDLARPALYDAHHPIQPVRKTGAASQVADVVGPVCESGDYLARNRRLPKPASGDLLAVLMAGAYGFSMSSQYNARPRAAEVLVMGRRWWLVRERESLDDLVRGEKIPSGLKG